MTDLAFDAVLLLSFGGPDGPEDVLPFLENVTRGRGVPPERLAVVAEQYLASGGKSPINDQNRALLDALRAELGRRSRDVPVFWGNRNWRPFVEDTLAEIHAAGHGRVLAVATSAFSSYSGCRQYHEDIDRARTAVGDGAPVVTKVRPYWNLPGFHDAMVDRVETALAEHDGDSRLVFTAHSIPRSMASTSDYEVQLRDAASRLAAAVGHDDWDLAWQSRSGPPQVPWLEPDIVAHLRTLRATGTNTVTVVPVGFVSDHQEVVYDLDTVAATAAADLGLSMSRAGTVGTHPAFVSSLVDLLDEHLVGGPVTALGDLGARVHPCAAGCCPAPIRQGRPGHG